LTESAPTQPPAGASPWGDALLALALFAIDPPGTGVCLHAPAGPVRDAWLQNLARLVPAGTALRKMPATIGEEALLGGLDFAATLHGGRRVVQRGFLPASDGGIVLAAMAERLAPGTAAIVAATLDEGVCRAARDPAAHEKPCRFGVVALDESIAEEAVTPVLLDRLAFLIDLTPLSHHDCAGAADTIPDAQRILAARNLLGTVSVEDEVLEALCGTAAALGAGFVRAPLLALHAARASAALAGRSTATMEDAAVAARLVLAPRATRLPAEPPKDEAEPPPDSPPDEPQQDQPPQNPPDANKDESENETKNMPPEGAEMVLEAAKAAIPSGLLAQLMAADFSRPARAGAGKAGARQKGGVRGRPVGVRAAPPSPGLRLNLIETLRAAAPWQRLRRTPANASATTIKLRREDFRVTRVEQRTRTTTIFLVDASGSSALNRLAEAKGAVELLLADCYQRRDEVAVLAFRGRAAQLLLPPTRSLVRAKRSLGSLPGGGGTPLAAGLEAGFLLAETVKRGGDTPTLVLLTDGRANVSLSGEGGRVQAEQDARQAGRRLRAAGHKSLFVDISPRPSEQARRIAQDMGALYVPLPYASAAAVSSAVRAAAARR